MTKGASRDTYYTLSVWAFFFNLFSADVKSSWKNRMWNKELQKKLKYSLSGSAVAVHAKLHDTQGDILLLSFQLCIKAISIHKMHCMIFKDNKLSQPCYRSYPNEGFCNIRHHLTTSYVLLPSGPLRSYLMNGQHQWWQHIHFLFRDWPEITILGLQDLPVFHLKSFNWRHDNSMTAVRFS